jgi:hypothetical protein
VKVFGVLKQVADFDVRVCVLDLLEFNSGFFLEGCGNLEIHYVQCVKNRIPKLGTGLFTLRSAVQYLVYAVYSESDCMCGSNEIVTGHGF